MDQLQSRPVSELLIVKTLESGILQKSTGKKLAPFFVEAMMRSIKPVEELKHEELHHFVEIIINQPSDVWADCFGEEITFGKGRINQFIQSKLDPCRTLQKQQIARGELLNDSTWNALRDFVQEARGIVDKDSDTKLNICLRNLEDFSEHRPSPEDAGKWVNKLLRIMVKPGPNELETLEAGVGKAQTLSTQIYSIKAGETTQLAEMSSQKETSPVSYFVFDTSLIPASVRPKGIGPQWQILRTMQEIESKSSFYNEVVTTGPRPGRSLQEKFVYALNALSTLKTAEMLQFCLPATPTKLPAVPSANPPQPEKVEISPAALKAQVKELEGLVKEFKASIKPQAPASSEHKTPVPVQSSASASAIPDEGMLDQLSQSIRNVLGRLEDPLRFPEASAASESIPLVGLDADPQAQRLHAMEAGEEYEPLQDGPTYSDTVEPNSASSWREVIAPVVRPVVNQLASVINTFGSSAASAAANSVQLVKNNPVATGATFLVTGGILAGLGFILAQLRDQFPVQPADIAPGDAPPAINNGPAPTQQQLDEELETNADTSVETQTSDIATSGASTTLGQQPPVAESETTSEPVDFGTSNDIPVTESPALHQELIEDKIEEILDIPVAKGQSALSTSILELMYQSPEHNLLDDTQLLQQVATLLEQHSTKEPAKSYVELIQEAEAQTHGAQDVAQAALPRAKRDTASVEARPLSQSRAAGEIEKSSLGEEKTPENEAVLIQYLATMDGLQSADLSKPEDIENDTSTDPALSAARDVVQLLRNRRSTTWTENSRASGDKRLVEFYYDKLLDYVDAPVRDNQIKMQVPPHSTFGQCWSNFVSAINNPFFISWAQKTGLDLTTIKISAVDGSLSGETNGISKTYTLTDDSGWTTVASPILSTASVIDPLYDGVHYATTNSQAPFLLVAAFHGENRHLTQNEAYRRGDELLAQGAFSPITTDDWHWPLDSRSEDVVASQKRHLGDIYNR
ncbi:hypothetical protein [Pseudomonas azerbaijanoccidentalis]